MRYYQFEDPFINKQPEKAFIKDLTRPMHESAPKSWNKREKKENEIFISCLKLNFSFPDVEGLLETSYADFREFMKSSSIKEGEDILLSTIYQKTDCKESYTITIDDNSIIITAGETEGIRRALIFIEDMMISNGGAYLEKKTISRHPFLKTRISRCTYSPPSHNDNHGMLNELEDDSVDYYPEAYLNRLMHDGINGLWIGANFRDILKSDIFPEFGQDSERRLKKLKAISERCRKYGIGIYIFSVEPASTYRNPALEKRTELHGGTAWGGKLRLFCTSTPEFEAYIRESITRLFEAVPYLAGFINITAGECLSGCGSTVIFDCPRCKEKYGTRGATLAATEKMFADVMKEVAPHAEFISWTYAQRGWDRETFLDSLERRDTSVIHMQNFEDAGKCMQLGRERTLYDYWLAYVGPGKIITDSLEVNKRKGIKTYAKLQICTSFDFSSVPYVPAPGILYDKFKAMRSQGISGALLCWYFGNYPGLMNKAACELAFEPFFESKRDFLVDLAKKYWHSDANRVADAWEKFEESYKNIPLNKAFTWFCPFADAPARPLHLKPVDLPMPSSWKYIEPVDSDRIGEALLDGHSLDEAAELSSIMRKLWNDGMKSLNQACENEFLPCIDQKVVASTIKILIDSGNNIILFYQLRRLLGLNKGDTIKILSQMKDIVKEEIENSTALIPLCEKYPYLGYMSEANGFKFFKEKLLWRIESLRELLETEFVEVEKRIKEGRYPLAFYRGEEEKSVSYRIYKGEIDNATPMCFIDGKGDESNLTTIQVAENEQTLTFKFTLKDSENDTIAIQPEFRMFHPSAPFTIGKGKIWMSEQSAFGFTDVVFEKRKQAIKCNFEKKGDTEIFTMTFNREDLNMDQKEIFRFAINRNGKHKQSLAKDDRIFQRLNLGNISPDSFVMFI